LILIGYGKEIIVKLQKSIFPNSKFPHDKLLKIKVFLSLFFISLIFFGFIFNTIYMFDFHNSFNINKQDIVITPLHFFYYSIATATSLSYDVISAKSHMAIAITLLEVSASILFIAVYFAVVKWDK